MNMQAPAGAAIAQHIANSSSTQLADLCPTGSWQLHSDLTQLHTGTPESNCLTTDLMPSWARTCTTTPHAGHLHRFFWPHSSDLNNSYSRNMHDSISSSGTSSMHLSCTPTTRTKPSAQFAWDCFRPAACAWGTRGLRHGHPWTGAACPAEQTSPMFITFKIHYLRHADHTLCRVQHMHCQAA